jgi:hypothetical protein
VSYPFENTQKKIIAAGIPKMYADRLAPGSNPSESVDPSKNVDSSGDKGTGQ